MSTFRPAASSFSLSTHTGFISQVNLAFCNTSSVLRILFSYNIVEFVKIS